MRIHYTLTTIDPVIISQENSTTNNHLCLDYIPGSAILGMLASEHYQHLSEQESWDVFHSGKCRFSPCYPVLNNEICLPTPASWYFEKGTDIQKDEQLNKAKISNHAAVDFLRAEKVQYKQCRDGYINSAGGIPEVKQGLITKTAIDRVTGKAKNASLFSYSFIEANQTFSGWVDCDNQAYLDQLKSSLDQVRRIGRSRNSEFGRVQLSLVEVDETIESHDNNQVTLWCLSDCELIDVNGFPCLSPNGDAIHGSLEGLKLNAGKSFIRTNKVRRFNQKRQGLDSEQLLIAKGSVLVFDGEISTGIAQEINQNGIGINKQQGLGWVSVNPLWANNATLAQSLFCSLKLIDIAVGAAELEVVESPFTQWINEQASIKENTLVQHKVVEGLLADIIGCYKKARRYNNVLNHLEAGPSSTQWRRIADKVRNTNTNWQIGVFEDENYAGNKAKENVICKATNDEFGWGIEWYSGQGQISFASAVKGALGGKDVFTMRLLLEKLCRHDLSTYSGLVKSDSQNTSSSKTTEGTC